MTLYVNFCECAGIRCGAEIKGVLILLSNIKWCKNVNSCKCAAPQSARF